MKNNWLHLTSCKCIHSLVNKLKITISKFAEPIKSAGSSQLQAATDIDKEVTH